MSDVMSDVRRGLIMVNPGPGKGKTTAAMGTALRAVGNGMRVLMLQFIKGSWHYGELDAVQAFGGKFVMKQMGRGFVKVGAEKPDPEDVRMVGEGWVGGGRARDSFRRFGFGDSRRDQLRHQLRHARSREGGRGPEAQTGNGARDLDGTQRASDNRRGRGHGDRNAPGEARVRKGRDGAARD